MRDRRRFGYAGLAACLMVVGCGGGGSGASATGAEGTSGGEQASYDGPIASTDVQRGAEQFDVMCGTCHPDGDEDIGPTLLSKRFSAPYVRKMVREGSGRMRPIPSDRMSGDDLEAVLAYMVTLDAVETE